ncbi:MAG: 2-polyprenyl-3-methyl-6-methoxy-1,4-benzoquinone monooxygenase [Burkholderiales bacterium]
MNILDDIAVGADSMLRTLAAQHRSRRPHPRAEQSDAPLTESERRLSGALMRVNHVGEVCAQALYNAQALGTRDPAIKKKLLAASQEESDHLAWTEQRMLELGTRPSLLNPLWYGGAFALGLLAASRPVDVGLGFVVETERQVEQHLAGHLDRLPANDTVSRAIVQQMKADEAEHAAMAQAAGAADLPGPAKSMMRLAAKVMTTVAHRI